jgi:plasmid stabilization system protein ParE
VVQVIQRLRQVFAAARAPLIGYGRCARSPEPRRMRSRKSRTVGFRRVRAEGTAGLAARRVSIVA